MADGDAVGKTHSGEDDAPAGPPLRPNGAAIIEAYRDHRLLPEFADELEKIHEDLNGSMEVEDPWTAA